MATALNTRINSFQNTPTQAPIASTAPAVAYKALVVGEASKAFTKSNGNEFVYIKVQLLEGNASGLVVLGMRTIVSNGVEKSIPALEQEVTVYHTKLASTKEAGKFQHFFEISTGDGVAIATQDELSGLL